MPVLEITDGKGHLLGRSVDHLIAAMLFPAEPDLRKRRVISQTIEHHFRTASASPYALSATEFEVLREMPEREQWLRSIRLRREHGEVAGWILTRLLYLHHRRPQDASVNKSIAVEIEARRKEGKPASPAHVKSLWSSYKSVSHLWGAVVMWMGDSERSLQRLYSGNDHILEFLAFAESLRELGEGIQIPRHSGAVLDSTEMWKPPPDLDLTPAGLTLGGEPAESLVKILDGYRAPRDY